MKRNLGIITIATSIAVASWVAIIPFLDHRRRLVLEEEILNYAATQDRSANDVGLSRSIAAHGRILPARDERRSALFNRSVLAMIIALSGVATGLTVMRVAYAHLAPDATQMPKLTSNEPARLQPEQEPGVQDDSPNP